MSEQDIWKQPSVQHYSEAGRRYGTVENMMSRIDALEAERGNLLELLREVVGEEDPSLWQPDLWGGVEDIASISPSWTRVHEKVVAALAARSREG